MLSLNPDFQLLRHVEKEDIATPGNLVTGHPVSGLRILGLQLLDGMSRKVTLLGWRYPCTRSIGSRSSTERVQKHSCYCGFETILPLRQTFVFANLETGT